MFPSRPATVRACAAFAVLLVPLVAIHIWVVAALTGYPVTLAVEDAIVAFALVALLALIARWRLLGPLSWPFAWLAYVVELLLALSESASYYIQGSSFNERFFSNLRLGNLRSAWDAFPALVGSLALLAVVMLVLAAWIFRRLYIWFLQRPFPITVVRAILLLGLAVVAVLLPSTGRRLAGYIVTYVQSAQLANTGAGHKIARNIDPNPVPRSAIRATPGANLVIIYMESLERIYTDDKIFPGLTPNLNRYRAQGLDFSGYLTFPGATYTMAGIFASQCGAPFFVSPAQAFEFADNDTNDTTFQPSLACLGDILHKAGYQQVFMNGSPLSFANQGAFFRIHGFDGIYGLDELLESEADLHKARYGRQAQWGLYDSDLFALASKKFTELADAGKPFNLDVLTIDNHPPHGRPSPGCPGYAANKNTVLQAVHCTDYLVGKFLERISKNPAYKNTVVVVMSDHQSMVNDAWPLYPPTYKRRPLLFILNAGKGERAQRFYHMDIAPTVLQLMGVHTNADFIAGSDRSAVDAPDSPLVDNPTTAAVLRKAIWARSAPLQLCKNGALMDGTGDALNIGNHDVPLNMDGVREVGLASNQLFAIYMRKHLLTSDLTTEDKWSSALARRASDPMLVVSPLKGVDPSGNLFSIDWIGKHGARAHLADAPRLNGLQVRSAQCASLLDKVNQAPKEKHLDLSNQFSVKTAPLHPLLGKLPITISLKDAGARFLQHEYGWLNPEPWGSWTMGNSATLSFALPPAQCHRAQVQFKVHASISSSRPKLDVHVLVNGKQMTEWHFDKTSPKWPDVSTPIETDDPQCHVDLRFVYDRPGAAPPPYPAGVDPRPLQLDFVTMQVGAAADAPTSLASRKP